MLKNNLERLSEILLVLWTRQVLLEIIWVYSLMPISQDTGSGLQAVDRIAERLQLDGVYGPLYRLFEVIDQNYNTAVELTAGTR